MQNRLALLERGIEYFAENSVTDKFMNLYNQSYPVEFDIQFTLIGFSPKSNSEAGGVKSMLMVAISCSVGLAI